MRHPRSVALSCLLLMLGAGPFAEVALATPPASARLWASGITEPVAIAHAPGDHQHLFVAGLSGVIRVVDLTTKSLVPTPFADLRSVIARAGDGGLAGLAFDPDYATNGYFYVFYNAAPNPPNDRVLARYHATPGALTADAGSGTILLQYPRTIGHGGGWIGFSPVNGLLYLSSGDGGNSFSFDAPNNAQTIVNQLQGKMMRIDVHGGDDFPTDPLRNYHIPPQNPFVGAVGDDEIWAYGLRNPWRCSFDRGTGDLYIADVGQDEWEEINVEPPTSPGGRNYGWKCMEGNHCTGLLNSCTCGDASLTLPAFEYDHLHGHSITGGYVYRGTAIPSLTGLYVFGDFQDNRFWTLRVVAGAGMEFTERTQDLTLPSGAIPSNISAFGEDADGELYMCDFFTGALYKFVPYVQCPADFNGIGGLTVQDIFDFLAAWFSGLPSADFNGTGGISVQDIFDFLSAWFVGCP